MSADRVKYTVTIQPPRTWEQTHVPKPEAEPRTPPRRLHPKQTRAEQRALHQVESRATASDASAPPCLQLTATELELLRAKATVCDRYMRWLKTSERDDRLLLAAALQHTRKLEILFKGGW